MSKLTFTTNFPEFQQTFGRYVALRKKSIVDALDHQGQQLAFDLYRSTLKASPTKQSLFATPARIGWRIKRPKGYAVFNIIRTPKKSDTDRNRDRARKVRGLKPLKRSYISKPGEMEHRVKTIGVTARSWLPRVWRSGSKGRWTLSRVKTPKGQIVYEAFGDRHSLTLINLAPGMPGMESKHGIVVKALQSRIKDMEVYIQRKLNEEHAKL